MSNLFAKFNFNENPNVNITNWDIFDINNIGFSKILIKRMRRNNPTEHHSSEIQQKSYWTKTKYLSF